MKKTQYGTKAAGKKLRKSSSKPEHKQGYSVQKPVQKKRSQKPEQGKVKQAVKAKPVLDQAFFEESIPNSGTTDLMSKVLSSKRSK